MKIYTRLYENRQIAIRDIAILKKHNRFIDYSVRNGVILVEYSSSSSVSNIKLTGKIPRYVSPLIYDFVEFVRHTIRIDNSIAITIKFKHLNKNEFGFVNFNSVVKGNNKIEIAPNVDYKLMLQHISHELTHIKQINKHELQVVDNYFMWKNNRTISIDEYNSIAKQGDIKTYKNLEWEKEAYRNQIKLTNRYIKSNEFKNSYKETTEPNLKFILQTI